MTMKTNTDVRQCVVIPTLKGGLGATLS